MPIIGTIASASAKGYGFGRVSSPSIGYFSIASGIVDASESATITFSSIPQTYTHLQIRCTARSSYSYSVDDAYMQFNGDTGNNYGNSNWYGAAPFNSTININQNVTTDNINWAQAGGMGTTAVGQWGLAVIDILDYTSTSKKKSIRVTSGMSTDLQPLSGIGGRVGNATGLWNNTNAINEIKLYASAGRPFNRYSVFSLYGIK
jgi:hypothetical protein